MRYKHNKTGRIYTTVDRKITNATNDPNQDGKAMILYHYRNEWFVREVSEFLEKFTKLKD